DRLGDGNRDRGTGGAAWRQPRAHPPRLVRRAAGDRGRRAFVRRRVRPPSFRYRPALPAMEATKEKGEQPHDPNLVLVKSPIVGTFYEAASPEAPPFVRVGERVQPGKVLCIIESMKLMNEIESETSGIIESKLVMNGQPVEYGEALFAVRTV